MTEILDCQQVADMLKLSAGWVLDHASVAGKPGRRRPYLKAIKFGEGKSSPVRFRREDVEAFIAAHSGETQS